MIYATNVQSRRDLINCAFRILVAKDPIASMKKFEKKYGSIIRDAQAFAYEVKGTACMAVCEDEVDAKLSAANGWKTIEQLKAEAYSKLKNDMV